MESHESKSRSGHRSRSGSHRKNGHNHESRKRRLPRTVDEVSSAILQSSDADDTPNMETPAESQYPLDTVEPHESSTSELYTSVPSDHQGIDELIERMNDTQLSSVHARWQRREIHGNPAEPYEKFDPSYMLHNSREFKLFRLFKVLWSEPRGNRNDTGGTELSHSVRDRNGYPEHAEVRRFVIVAQKRGHSLCLPIHTYGGQGAMKSGIQAHDHTIVYHTEHPHYSPGERARLTRAPLRIEMESSRHKLNRMSRLNYSKVYTVEHNVKVCFIGKVHHEWRKLLVDEYNASNPPMSAHGLFSAPTPDIHHDVQHTTGGQGVFYPLYQPQYQGGQGYPATLTSRTFANQPQDLYRTAQDIPQYSSSSIQYPPQYANQASYSYPVVASAGTYEINTQQAYRYTDPIPETNEEGSHGCLPQDD